MSIRDKHREAAEQHRQSEDPAQSSTQQIENPKGMVKKKLLQRSLATCFVSVRQQSVDMHGDKS